jgi:hypothetical protein
MRYMDAYNALIAAADDGSARRIRAAILRGVSLDGINEAFGRAARGGRMAAMLTLRELWADDLDGAFEAAASGGRIDEMKFLRDCGACQFNTALANAAEANCDEAVDLLLSWGATRLEWALLTASRSVSAHSDAETLERIYQLAGGCIALTWLNDSLAYAVRNWRWRDKVVWLVNHGATDLDRALDYTVYHDNGAMYALLLRLGARVDRRGDSAADSAATSARLQKIWDAQMAIDARRGHHARLVTLALVLAPFGLSVYEEMWIFAWAVKGPLPESRCLRILDRVHASLA